MQNPNVQKAQFTPDQFRNLAALNPNLRVEQVRGIHVTRDGQQITLMTTVSGERIGDKRALGTYEHGVDHALDSYVEVEGMKLIAGTPGIQNSRSLPAIVAGIQGLLDRERKNTLVCGKPAGEVGYFLLYANQAAPSVDLTEHGKNFAQVVYLPKPRGFVAREAGSNCLWFLSFEQARRGEISRTAWKTSGPLVGVKAITSLPPRIQDAHAVLCQTVETSGAIASDTLNFAGIANEQIASVARESGVDDVAFRCFATREVAIVETGAQARTLEPNSTYQVPTEKLPELFGKAGKALIQAVAA